MVSNFIKAIVLYLILVSAGKSANAFANHDSTAVHAAKSHYTFRQLSVPLTFFSVSFLTLPESSPINRIKVRDAVLTSFPGFRTHIDDALWALPLVGIYVFPLAGQKGRNDLLNATLLIIKSQLITEMIVQPLKYATCVLRPDSTTRNSFPSGHTARAFAAATCFHREFGSRSIWYSAGGYTLAATTGILRILNNRHWLPDVLAGASIGILSAQLAYGTHRFRWGNRSVQMEWKPVWIEGTGKQLMFVLNW